MDRVWQLEHETFQDTPGFVFVPITDVVEPSEDPTALHPEVQRQMANIRTDFDRFSLLEISSLVRHGYCVGRKACQARPDLFGADLPRDVPWDPVPRPYGAAAAVPVATPAEGHSIEPAETMVKGTHSAGLRLPPDLEFPVRFPGLELVHLRAAFLSVARSAALRGVRVLQERRTVPRAR